VISIPSLGRVRGRLYAETARRRPLGGKHSMLRDKTSHKYDRPALKNEYA